MLKRLLLPPETHVDDAQGQDLRGLDSLLFDDSQSCIVISLRTIKFIVAPHQNPCGWRRKVMRSKTCSTLSA